MSDSETATPSATAISDAIRQVVISIHKSGSDDGLTVNAVRTGAEQKLRVSAGFLKQGNWKEKSKKLIKEAVVCTHLDIGITMLHNHRKADTKPRTSIAETNLRQHQVQKRSPNPQLRRSLVRTRIRSQQPKVHPAEPKGKQQFPQRSKRSVQRLYPPTRNQRVHSPIRPWRTAISRMPKAKRPSSPRADRRRW